MGSVRLWRRETVILAGITLVGLALRFWHIGFQSLWRDEADAIRFATQPISGLLSMFTTPGENGPLYFLALRPWLALFGTSEAGLRSFSAIPGALLIPVMFWLGAKLFGRRAGWRFARRRAVHSNVPHAWF